MNAPKSKSFALPSYKSRAPVTYYFGEEISFCLGLLSSTDDDKNTDWFLLHCTQNTSWTRPANYNLNYPTH